jgi:hypothetical protein
MEDLFNPLWWQEFFSRLLFFIKVVSGIISFIMFLMVVHLARKTGWWEGHQKYAGYYKPPVRRIEAKNKLTTEWNRITARLVASDEANSKLAVIEADKLFDTLIKDMGIAGDTMGERLKKLSAATLPSIHDLWEVHKLRNHIVHTADFHITPIQAARAIATYEKVLKDLNAI